MCSYHFIPVWSNAGEAKSTLLASIHHSYIPSTLFPLLLSLPPPTAFHLSLFFFLFLFFPLFLCSNPEMAAHAMMEGPSSVGFDFSHHARNQFLGASLNGLPKGMSLSPVSSFLCFSLELTNLQLRRRVPRLSVSSLAVEQAVKRKVSALAQTRERRAGQLSQTRTVKRSATLIPSKFAPGRKLMPSQIHYLTPSIRCCGAGTAADTE